jgi:SAM-dependent methyltransferase
MTLDYIIAKYGVIDFTSPIKIPGGRSQLAKLFNELDFKIGVEVGVWKGQYSQKLCQRNPGVKLYCIDPWEVYEGFPRGKESMERAYEITKETLKEYSCNIIRKPSMEAVKNFDDETLDFVYIDGDHHFENVLEDIREWSKKVRPGGIVSGHDYRCYWRNTEDVGVSKAVDMCAEGKKLFVYNWDRSSSWFYVKE